MKQVFGSHSELAHVWASQSQESGRAGNMFFSGACIYSYGYHYKIAEIFKRGGKRYALINSDGYSVSTAKHTYRVRDALRGLMPTFDAPGAVDYKAAIKHADDNAHEYLEGLLKRRVGLSREDSSDRLGYALARYQDASEVRKFFGRKAIFPTTKKWEALTTHERHLVALWEDPKAVAKRAVREETERAERERREAEYAAQNAKRIEEAKGELEKWLAGAPCDSWKLSCLDLEHDLLRIEGDEVVTQRGARVPLKQARSLLELIQRGEESWSKAVGRKVGPYTFDGVQGDVAVIGCHRIALDHAAEVLGAA